MKKTRLTALLALTMAAALCASCATKPAGGGSQPAASGEAAAPETKTDQVTVTVISVNDTPKLFHKEIIPIFEAENPNIKVEFIETPFDQFDTKIQTMLASGTPLDTTTHNGWTGFGGRLANGQLLELDALIEKHGFDAAAMNIPEAASNVWKVNGKTYAIPVHIFPSFLLYNKDLFDAAGLDYPPVGYDDASWTFDKMLDYAKQLTKDPEDPVNGQYGLSWNWHCGGNEQISQYFGHLAFDEATFTDNMGFATESYFDSPEVIADFQRTVDLVYKDKVSPTAAMTEAMGGSAFFAGKAGMYVDGGWVLAGTNDIPFKVGIAAIPAGGNDKVRATMWIDPYWIFKDSKCPDETFKYIQFMLRDDIQKKIVEASDGLAPANMSAFDTFSAFFKNVDAADMRVAFDGGIQYGFEGMSHLMADSSTLNTLMTNETDPMFKEGKPAAEVLPQVQKKITEFIASTKEKYKK